MPPKESKTGIAFGIFNFTAVNNNYQTVENSEIYQNGIKTKFKKKGYVQITFPSPMIKQGNHL
jgi:hypothetical protein